MIEFNANNMEELEEEARLKATEISLAIVEGICNGLEEDADVVALGILSNLDMDITVKRENYLEALKLNIHRVEEAEEYELCSRAVKWIEHLQTEQE
jgi:hypothetical protein